VGRGDQKKIDGNDWKEEGRGGGTEFRWESVNDLRHVGRRKKSRNRSSGGMAPYSKKKEVNKVGGEGRYEIPEGGVITTRIGRKGKRAVQKVQSSFSGRVRGKDCSCIRSAKKKVISDGGGGEDRSRWLGDVWEETSEGKERDCCGKNSRWLEETHGVGDRW